MRLCENGKEQFKAKSDKACQLLISVHTSGRTMTYQQPLNNIARCAIQTLAGAIAGCTAIDNACLDNAHAEPSAFAARMSLNTQHIVSDETGVTDVTDTSRRFLFRGVSHQQSGRGSI